MPLDILSLAQGDEILGGAELLDQPVVASAGADGVLRAEPVGGPLEHRPAVVIEATYQPGIADIVDAQRIEPGPQRGEVCCRLLVQVRDQLRRLGDQRLQVRVLAVQDAQRVAVQPTPAVLVQRPLVGRKIGLQQVAVAFGQMILPCQFKRRRGYDKRRAQSRPQRKASPSFIFYQFLKAYVFIPRAMPVRLQILPTTNSPSTIPMKNGIIPAGRRR